MNDYEEEKFKNFIWKSKSYTDVLKHRQKCEKWKNMQMCLECFGGGLTKFSTKLLKEFEVSAIKDSSIREKKIIAFKEMYDKVKSKIEKINNENSNKLDVVFEELLDIVKKGNEEMKYILRYKYF